jgi:hypothetical protein
MKALVALLVRLAEHREDLGLFDEPDRRALLIAAGQLARPSPAERSKLKKLLRRKDRERRREHDTRVLSGAQMRASAMRLALPPPTDGPLPDQLLEPRGCYICKDEYQQVHFFYHSMCPGCATLNYAKRSQTHRLDGRVALVTGARVKIGYQTALILLRAGARVVALTRFPRDAARRYAQEADFGEWKDRL